MQLPDRPSLWRPMTSLIGGLSFATGTALLATGLSLLEKAYSCYFIAVGSVLALCGVAFMAGGPAWDLFTYKTRKKEYDGAVARNRRLLVELETRSQRDQLDEKTIAVATELADTEEPKYVSAAAGLFLPLLGSSLRKNEWIRRRAIALAERLIRWHPVGISLLCKAIEDSFCETIIAEIAVSELGTHSSALQKAIEHRGWLIDALLRQLEHYALRSMSIGSDNYSACVSLVQKGFIPKSPQLAEHLRATREATSAALALPFRSDLP